MDDTGVVGRVPDGTRLSSSTEPQSSQGLGPTGFDPSRRDLGVIRQVFIRVCRDSGFHLDMHRACALAAKIVGRHPMEVWMAMPSLDVMGQIARGEHPAACRDRDRDPEGDETAKTGSVGEADRARAEGIVQKVSS